MNYKQQTSFKLNNREIIVWKMNWGKKTIEQRIMLFWNTAPQIAAKEIVTWGDGSNFRKAKKHRKCSV